MRTCDVGVLCDSNQLNLTIDNYTLTDTILWSAVPNPFNPSPEQFAIAMCADLGLGSEWSVLIAYTIRQHIERDRQLPTASPPIEHVRGPTAPDQLFRSIPDDAVAAGESEWDGPCIERLDGVRPPDPIPFVPGFVYAASINGGLPVGSGAPALTLPVAPVSHVQPQQQPTHVSVSLPAVASTAPVQQSVAPSQSLPPLNALPLPLPLPLPGPVPLPPVPAGGFRTIGDLAAASRPPSTMANAVALAASAASASGGGGKQSSRRQQLMDRAGGDPARARQMKGLFNRKRIGGDADSSASGSSSDSDEYSGSSDSDDGPRSKKFGCENCTKKFATAAGLTSHKRFSACSGGKPNRPNKSKKPADE